MTTHYNADSQSRPRSLRRRCLMFVAAATPFLPIPSSQQRRGGYTQTALAKWQVFLGDATGPFWTNADEFHEVQCKMTATNAGRLGSCTCIAAGTTVSAMHGVSITSSRRCNEIAAIANANVPDIT